MITEKPHASYEVSIGERRGTYVPIAVVDPAPDWVREIAGSWHGEGHLISGTWDNGSHVLFVPHSNNLDGWNYQIPPGDWLVYYNYNHDDGTHDHKLCVAARITTKY